MRLIGGLLIIALALAPAAVWGAASSQGVVAVTYDLHRIPAVASNQVAVWIEDAEGKYVKTLYVSWFTGKGGYERRPDCLPLWRKAAGIDGPPTADVDAVTRATGHPGRQSFAWDCTDAAGRPVAPGIYVYKVEGTVFREKEVLWTGEIAVGSGPASSRAAVRYLPDNTAGADALVTGVGASFSPAGGY